MGYLVVVTAHDEGQLVTKKILSVRQQTESIYPQSTNLLVVLDSPDNTTRAAVRETGVGYRETNYSDVGLVRNAIIDEFAGQVEGIFFIDGDDTCCDHWFNEAILCSRTASGPAIISPGYRVHTWRLGGRLIKLSFRQPAQDENSWWLYKRAATLTNLWGSAMLLKTPIPDELRFRAEQEGTLFEDWELNKAALKLGVRRITTLGAHYYFQRSSSRRRDQASTSWSQLKLRERPSVARFKLISRKSLALIIMATLYRPKLARGACDCRK